MFNQTVLTSAADQTQRLLEGMVCFEVFWEGQELPLFVWPACF